jgi:hypothetical protein
MTESYFETRHMKVNLPQAYILFYDWDLLKTEWAKILQDYISVSSTAWDTSGVSTP